MAGIVLKGIKQSAGLSGPASLSILLRHYQIKMSERELADLSRSSKGYGSDTEALFEALKKLGFASVSGTRGTLSLLTMLVTHGTPVVVSLLPSDMDNRNHYVVVTKVTAKQVSFVDPATGGTRSLGKPRFLKEWKALDLQGNPLPHWYLHITQ